MTCRLAAGCSEAMVDDLRLLLLWRWVVERSSAWVARFRRLARDYERLPATVADLHLVALACLMLHQFMYYSLNP